MLFLAGNSEVSRRKLNQLRLTKNADMVLHQ